MSFAAKPNPAPLERLIGNAQVGTWTVGGGRFFPRNDNTAMTPLQLQAQFDYHTAQKTLRKNTAHRK